MPSYTREDEACQVLQTSTSDLEIVTVCRFFPFRDSNTPLAILSQRWSARLNSVLRYLGSAKYDLKDDEPRLRKAEEILERTAAVSLDPPIWDWEWSPPVASSMKPVQVADNIVGKTFTAFSKVSFLAFVKRALGFHTVSVTDLLNGLVHLRLELCRRFEELDQPKEPYIAVGKELQNKCPLAFWAVSTSVWHTNVSLDPSDALSSILIPIRELFEDRELPLIPMLQRLEILAILHQNILDGADHQWNGLLFADFSFLGYINDHKPQEVAELLTNYDLSCCRKLSQDAFSWPVDGPLPRSLRVIGTKWTTLVVIVAKLCANAPDLNGSIIETAKVLLDGRNFFSGMALLAGLQQANNYSAELLNYWKLLNSDDNFAHYRVCWSSGYGIPFFPPHLRMLLTAGAEVRKATVLHDLLRYMAYTGLLQRIGDNPGESSSKPTRAETRCGRTCTWPFSEFTSTLWLNPFAGMQRRWACCFWFSGRTERDFEKGISGPQSQAVEFHMKSEEEMHEEPPLDPLLKERESDQGMNSISKHLLEGTNGTDFESMMVQKSKEKSEREKSYVDRPIRMRKKVMWCCDCGKKVSFAGEVCCICCHESTECGECLHWRSSKLEDKKCDNE